MRVGVLAGVDLFVSAGRSEGGDEGRCGGGDSSINKYVCKVCMYGVSISVYSRVAEIP